MPDLSTVLPRWAAKMLGFTFLRQGMRANKKKQQWQNDVPLPTSAGGSLAALSPEGLLQQSANLREGGRYIGLGCLTMLSHELSAPQLQYDETVIEQLGRQMWSKEAEVSPHLRVAPPEEDFWKTHLPSFPRAWPDKCSLPVSVSNAGVFPARFRLLAMDEIVLSFWKFVGHTIYLGCRGEEPEGPRSRERPRGGAREVESGRGLLSGRDRGRPQPPA